MDINLIKVFEFKINVCGNGKIYVAVSFCVYICDFIK